MSRLHVHLTAGGLPRSGHLNVEVAGDPPPGAVKGNALDLSEHVDANEAASLVALNVLDTLAPAEAARALEHWLTRLGHGGELTVSGVDLRAVARALVNGELTHDEADALVHGVAAPRRSSYSLPRLVKVLASRGLEVLSQRIVHFNAVVTARRP